MQLSTDEMWKEAAHCFFNQHFSFVSPFPSPDLSLVPLMLRSCGTQLVLSCPVSVDIWCTCVVMAVRCKHSLRQILRAALQTSVSLMGFWGQNSTILHCRGEIPECGTGLKTSAGRYKFHLIFPGLPGWCFTIHRVMRAALSLGQEFPKLCTSRSEAAKFPR